VAGGKGAAHEPEGQEEQDDDRGDHEQEEQALEVERNGDPERDQKRQPQRDALPVTVGDSV
jgi:hypothetical protein